MKSNIERFKLRRGRILVVDGIKWKWAVGKGGAVVAYSEKGELYCEKAWNIKGVTNNTFGRGQWKKTDDGSLFPSEVANWLRKPLTQ